MRGGSLPPMLSPDSVPKMSAWGLSCRQLESALERTADNGVLTRRIRSTLEELRQAAADVQTAAGQQAEERSRVMHLASIGLMIEILAHELYRATSAGLKRSLRPAMPAIPPRRVSRFACSTRSYARFKSASRSSIP